MSQLTVEQKYADPTVVSFWQKLGQQGLQQAEQAMIDRYLPAGGHLLDLGCGAGRAVRALTAQGYRVTGIDLSLPMLQAGSELADMELSGATLLRLPFAANNFRAAFMFFGALQHIEGRQNRRRALAEIARVVQPEGQLILGLDNLAPALSCYTYWLKQKMDQPLKSKNYQPALQPTDSSQADTTLWSRRTNPLIWHLRGLVRTLRWRTWPGLIDRYRWTYGSPAGPQPGDVQVAQFSQPPTPGRVYYHLYQPGELIADAASAGWQLLDYHSGRELSEGSRYPIHIRGLDKQLFFAFRKG